MRALSFQGYSMIYFKLRELNSTNCFQSAVMLSVVSSADTLCCDLAASVQDILSDRSSFVENAYLQW